MFIQLFILVFGFILLISGANSLVNGASGIAKKFNIPEILIGLTIVSLGTTLPELVVSIVSATTGSTDIVLGNVIGSNLCNLLLILGFISVLKPISFEKTTIHKNLPLLLILTFLILIMGIGILPNSKLTITKFNGIFLLIIAFFYFLMPIMQYLKQIKKENSESKNATLENSNKDSLIIKHIIYIILGGLALKYGGDFVVDSATNIAHMLSIPERVIGLTIVALGTSLPELITSVVAIIRGNDDIAEGNLIGACTINSCLVLGASAVISNIPFSSVYIEDTILLLICITLIWLFGLGNKNHTLKRSNGILLVLIYLIYSIKLFI